MRSNFLFYANTLVHPVKQYNNVHGIKSLMLPNLIHRRHISKPVYKNYGFFLLLNLKLSPSKVHFFNLIDFFPKLHSYLTPSSFFQCAGWVHGWHIIYMVSIYLHFISIFRMYFFDTFNEHKQIPKKQKIIITPPLSQQKHLSQ